MSTTAQTRAFAFRLDLRSGVPVYRQIIDQVMGGMAVPSADTRANRLPSILKWHMGFYLDTEKLYCASGPVALAGRRNARPLGGN